MRRNVAILIFPDVEVLDFAGPFEVFAVADELEQHRLFNVFTVAELSSVVHARNGLQVVPNHTFESSPKPDIVVVPGGFGTRALLENSTVLDWIRHHAASAELVVSVCTGSLVLAKAGLLAGKQATTHYLRHDLLREIEPRAIVREDRRFIDEGNIATSAGISAGIDLSLHLVGRLHGASVAEATARSPTCRGPTSSSCRAASERAS